MVGDRRQARRRPQYLMAGLVTVRSPTRLLLQAGLGDDGSMHSSSSLRRRRLPKPHSVCLRPDAAGHWRQRSRFGASPG